MAPPPEQPPLPSRVPPRIFPTVCGSDQDAAALASGIDSRGVGGPGGLQAKWREFLVPSRKDCEGQRAVAIGPHHMAWGRVCRAT